MLVWPNKIKLSKREWFSLTGGALALIASSFFIAKEKIGGTVMYRAHDWPHLFANYQIKDVLDKAIINKWQFTPGGTYSYLIANLIFYFSVLLFLFILFKTIKITYASS